MSSPPPRHPGGRPRRTLPCQLGQAIERAADRRGLRLDEVARAAGISLGSLYAIISGAQDPRISTVAALAEALGVTVGQLVAPRKRRRQSA